MYSRTDIRRWVKEVKDMQEKEIAAANSNGPELSDQEVEEAKVSDTKCPFCRKYMIVKSDNDIEKVFICGNCNSRWGYDKEIKRMYRIRG